MAQEIIRATVPANNNWHTEDLEAKATAMGMSKSDFILKAVDMMMNFGSSFYDYIKGYAEGLHIPEWVVIQNLVIKQIAKSQAKKKVWGAENRRLEEFIMVEDSKGSRMLTDQELLRALKDMYILNYQK